MRPRQYEELVAETLRREGWEAKLTSEGPDSGVDIFATKGEERMAVQVKMYGGASRKINRATVMELYGVAAYFDCDRALLATDGKIHKDAQSAANKLGVEIRVISSDFPEGPYEPELGDPLDFDSIWTKHILPLQGRTVERTGRGTTNEILQVDWSGIKRRTSSGKTQFIRIEIFRSVVHRLLSGQTVTRAWINDEYPGRASSGIVLILSQIPIFELAPPSAIKLRAQS